MPRRVSPKSNAFFQFSYSYLGVATSIPPTQPSLYSAFKCFGRSSKLVPLPCFSLYSSFFFPPLSRLSTRLFPFASLLPFAHPPIHPSPSFLSLRSSALSHLSAVSTSISKKSSRELSVGKCREPAVLRTDWNRNTEEGERDKGKRCRRDGKNFQDELFLPFSFLSRVSSLYYFSFLYVVRPCVFLRTSYRAHRLKLFSCFPNVRTKIP